MLCINHLLAAANAHPGDASQANNALGLFLIVLVMLGMVMIGVILIMAAHRRRTRQFNHAKRAQGHPHADPWRESARRLHPANYRRNT